MRDQEWHPEPNRPTAWSLVLTTGRLSPWMPPGVQSIRSWPASCVVHRVINAYVSSAGCMQSGLLGILPPPKNLCRDRDRSSHCDVRRMSFEEPSNVLPAVTRRRPDLVIKRVD